MSNENIVKHLEDIDQVLCDSNAQMGNVVTHLGRIALALEALVEQGKTKKPVSSSPAKKQPVKKEPVKKVEEVKTDVEEPVPEQSKTFTHADLKAACLTSARADSSNRDKLKALLSTYNANKAVDVPEDKLEEVIGKIEAGEF